MNSIKNTCVGESLILIYVDDLTSIYSSILIIPKFEMRKNESNDQIDKLDLKLHDSHHICEKGKSFP